MWEVVFGLDDIACVMLKDFCLFLLFISFYSDT